MAERCVRLDLVIPIYNEAHVLERSVHELMAAVERFDLPPWRVVVMDNGSTDGSRRVGEELEARHRGRVRYERLDRKGRGIALRTTWSGTDAALSLYMDVDLSTGLEAVPQVVELLESGADVVTGSRLHPRAQTERCLQREVLSRGYNLLVGLLFQRRGFDDAQCGFKGVRVASVRHLLPFVVNDHWFFDTELLVLAESFGMDVRSVPVRWVEDSDSRVRIAGTVWEDLRGLARLRRTLGGARREWRSEFAH